MKESSLPNAFFNKLGSRPSLCKVSDSLIVMTTFSPMKLAFDQLQVSKTAGSTSSLFEIINWNDLVKSDVLRQRDVRSAFFCA
jgi:hypothetical protein